MQILAACICGAGVALLLVAAAGLFRLPDALSRQHAATKSVTLALSLILLGVALISEDARFWPKVGAIFSLLMVTVPSASHMLARAAARQTYTEQELEDAPRVKAESAD
jgi:multicomponent Na+:H+ antiporter subunit G